MFVFWSFSAFKVTKLLNHSPKFIFFVGKLVKSRSELSTIINFLDHKYYDRMHDGVSRLIGKYSSYRRCLGKNGKSLLEKILNIKLE